MDFPSPVFLYLFLPASVVFYRACRGLPVVQNFVVLLTSLFFYAWGEPRFVPVLLAAVTGNYLLGRCLNQYRSKYLLALGILGQLTILIVWKYSHFFSGFHTANHTIPLGISFFTFQAISYLVDIFRGDVEAEPSALRYGVFALFFPHVLAGPIVRYSDIRENLGERPANWDDLAIGIRRFTLGLIKKVLLADTLAEGVNAAFALPTSELSAGAAWFTIAAFALQIYLDFSGYTDMAIGLARMFGFHFPENFVQPYLATSVADFWRRWHISLSTWFRDYVYIPLGGSRNGSPATFRNLMIVFVLCGLWHGANLTFVVWGLCHGAFLILERSPFGRILARLGPIRNAYTLMAVTLAWVFFRSPTLEHAWDYLHTMVQFTPHCWVIADFWNPKLVIVLPLAVLACFNLRDRWLLLIPLALPVCMVQIAAKSYTPFLYARF